VQLSPVRYASPFRSKTANHPVAGIKAAGISCDLGPGSYNSRYWKDVGVYDSYSARARAAASRNASVGSSPSSRVPGSKPPSDSARAVKKSGWNYTFH